MREAAPALLEVATDSFFFFPSLPFSETTASRLWQRTADYIKGPINLQLLWKGSGGRDMQRDEALPGIYS